MAKRNHQSESTPPALIEHLQSASSTQVQARFGAVLDQLRHGAIVIERHDRPVAVLLSVDEYAELHAGAQPKQQLDLLTHEFDALVDRIQTRASATGLARAFSASPQQLAAAAAEHIRGSFRARDEVERPASPRAKVARKPAAKQSKRK